MHVFVVLQAVLPVTLLLWLAVRRPTGRFDWAVGVLFVLGAIAAVALVVPWIFLPAWTRYFYLAATLILGIRSWTRRRPYARPGVRHVWRALYAWALAGVAILAWAIAGLAVDGRRVPAGEVMNLACPLEAGTYLVASGGSRELVNGHLATLSPDPRFLPWRGQSYGVDLVEVDRVGRRAVGVSSPNPSDYFIYGQFVVAPCEGTVIAAVDDRPDMAVPMRDPDRTRLAGNHIVLACGAYEVLLAHLQPGSIRVAAGAAVSRGDLLGFAGNSGNSDEPHLHVSAQRPVEGAPALGGQPVWISFDGVFPVRNDQLVCE